MNWQVASFLVLLAVLAFGFAWYERSRPPAKVLSLVAALAALATVGRIAFAPIPNVKPTTDIALFAGYALGPVPGFAVGAIAALIAVAPAPAQAGTKDAVAYLRAAQNSDGGFGGGRGTSSTSLHTGWAALGLAAAGVNPADVSKDGASAVDYLRNHAAGLTDI